MILPMLLSAEEKTATIPAASLSFMELILDRKAEPQELSTVDRLWKAVEKQDELLADWLWQDIGKLDVPAVLLENNFNLAFDHALAKAVADTVEFSDGRWKNEKLPRNCTNKRKLDYYKKVCSVRRQARLTELTNAVPRIVYARHFVMGGSHYAYTEALSDAQAERQFRAGGQLCMAEYQDGIWKESVLIDSTEGVIRDVDVDYDANEILFSWKKSDRDDDYSLYQMNLKSRQIRQLTNEPRVADYEGCYLPDGNILFSSTRCMQVVDCWWTEVSNMYRCNKDGKNIYRMGFDQVHVNYPSVGDDGNVLYTRWEYNDRSQMYPQPLFQMAPDGTMQRAIYGENSWFPTTIAHARKIPGSHKIFAVATGHHTRQPGALIMIDPARGQQEAEGVQLIAPVRETKAVRVDRLGQSADLFAYPYPLNQDSMLVTYNPAGWGYVNKNTKGREARKSEERMTGFGIYWMDINGNRELLVSRNGLACGRSVPLRPRKRPDGRPSMVDYKESQGSFYIQNVYVGEPMSGVEKGTIKTLRVIQIDYRAAGIGNNSNGGAGGGALVSTPIAIGNGTWDPKILVGDATVHADGSVFFKTDTRKPIYFMLLDEKGRMVLSMRSWTVLQPGENSSCIGCHEPKDMVPTASRPSMAMAAGIQKLAPVNGPSRGFSYLKEVQPILSKHCVMCHDGKDDKRPDLTATVVNDPNAKRGWTKSYLALTHAKPDDKKRQSKWRGKADHKVLNWISAGSTVKLLPPLSKGSNTSELFAERLDKGHCKTITLEEIKVLAMWVDLGVPFCEDYLEANLWNENEKKKFAYSMAKRNRAEKEDMETLKHLAETNP